MLSDYAMLIFFSECITNTDCPDGGDNYLCNANRCECPCPKILSGDKCVGMLTLKLRWLFTNKRLKL